MLDFSGKRHGLLQRIGNAAGNEQRDAETRDYGDNHDDGYDHLARAHPREQTLGRSLSAVIEDLLHLSEQILHLCNGSLTLVFIDIQRFLIIEGLSLDDLLDFIEVPYDLICGRLGLLIIDSVSDRLLAQVGDQPTAVG